jgi:hypothetical protein
MNVPNPLPQATDEITHKVVIKIVVNLACAEVTENTILIIRGLSLC